jgi:hypothetical protein
VLCAAVCFYARILAQFFRNSRQKK